MSLFSELSEVISGEVDVFQNTLDRVSHDASIFEVEPRALVSPKDAKDVEALVNYANNHSGINLTARSAGTDMSGGPLGNSVIVDFTKHFDQIKHVENAYAVVEPGVYYRDFDKATLAKGGVILPSFPASRELCTVGGMVANNSGGEKTLTYGKTEKYVHRLKMVTADGKEHEFAPMTLAELEQHKKFPSFESEIYRKMHELIVNNYEVIMHAKPTVTKNSCGYYLWNVMYDRPKINGAGKFDGTEKVFDLTKMIVGSQGTLGLVTEIEFGLIKPKPFSRLLIIFLKDMKQLGDIATHVMKFKPESFESYDDHTFRVALKFLPSLIKKMKGNFISMAFKFLPEALAVLRGGVPKMVLMAEFTGNTEEEALKKATEAHESLVQWENENPSGNQNYKRKVESRVTSSASDAEKYWTIRRESFNMLRQHVKELRTAPFIDDFVVRPELLPGFLPLLYGILDQYKHLTYTIAGHVGDGNFHIIPLMNLHNPSAHKTIEELSVKVYKLVHEFNGSITGEHNDGIIRTPFVKMQYGDRVYGLFEEVKKIWDPRGIFNPGKKVAGSEKDSGGGGKDGGTFKFAFEHIVK